VKVNYFVCNATVIACSIQPWGLQHAACYTTRCGGLNIVGSGFSSSVIWHRVTGYPVPDISIQRNVLISQVGNFDRLIWKFIPLKIRTLHCIETSGSDYPLTDRLVPINRLICYTGAKNYQSRVFFWFTAIFWRGSWYRAKLPMLSNV